MRREGDGEDDDRCSRHQAACDYFCEREIGSKGDRKLPQHPSKFLRGHPFSGVRHWEATCFPGPLLETKNKASFRGLKDFRYILPSACRSYM